MLETLWNIIGEARENPRFHVHWAKKDPSVRIVDKPDYGKKEYYHVPNTAQSALAGHPGFIKSNNPESSRS